MAVLIIIFLIIRLRQSQAAELAAKFERDSSNLTLELSEDIGRFGSWQVDGKAGTVEWSDYVFDMHERPRSRGHPHLDKAIHYYHPDDRNMVNSAVACALKEGQDFEFRARIITENGNELPVLARGTCRFGPDGEILGLFGCFVDMSAAEDRQ